MKQRLKSHVLLSFHPSSPGQQVPSNSVIPLHSDDRSPFGQWMFNQSQDTSWHSSTLHISLQSEPPVFHPNRGEGGGGGSNWGQEHWEEEGWANRQTLKVTIHHFTSNIKDTSNYRVQLRGSDTGWGISSIWPCVHVNWNAGRVTTRRNKIKLGNDTH